MSENSWETVRYGHIVFLDAYKNKSQSGMSWSKELLYPSTHDIQENPGLHLLYYTLFFLWATLYKEPRL